MRILHITKKYPDMPGGDAWYVHALVRAGRARGHEPFVVAPNCRELRREAGVRAVGRPLDSARLDRLGIHRLRLLRDVRRGLPELLAWSSPEIVHAHSADLGYTVSRAPEMRVPVVLTCHSLSFPALPSWSAKAFLERWCLQRGRFAAVTAVYPGAVEALRGLGLADASCIPAGVDAQLFTPGTQSEGDVFRLLFVGRLEPEKGLDTLLDAVALVRRPIRLSVVGNGRLRKALEGASRSRGLDGRVVFEGVISEREAMAARYREADALVLPSRTEGLPLSLLEAWASGLAVIATGVGGVADLAASGAVAIVSPRNPAALARTIETLAADPSLRRTMEQRGRSLAVERYGWNVVADQFLDLYGSLARR